MQIDHAYILKLIISYTCVGVFVATALATVLDLFNKLNLSSDIRGKLQGALLVEILVISVGTFTGFLAMNPDPVSSRVEFADKAEMKLKDLFTNNREEIKQKTFSVVGTKHSSGRVGQFFNFDVSDLDRIVGSTDWNKTKFIILNKRTKQTGLAELWRSPNGGEGTGHGRWDSGAGENQWQTGDSIVVIEH